MSEKKEPESEAGGEGADGAPAKKKLAGKQLILFIVAPAVLLLGGGGAAAWFFIFNKPPAAEGAADAKGEEKKDKEKDKKKEKDKEKGGEKKEGEPGQVPVLGEGPNGEGLLTLPDILVNIATSSDRPAYLKLKITLKTADTEVAGALEAAVPMIKDQLTGFLRELRTEDVAGSAGYQRLQLELLKRVNLAVAPAKVDAVLIEEMLVN